MLKDIQLSTIIYSWNVLENITTKKKVRKDHNCQKMQK